LLAWNCDVRNVVGTNVKELGVRSTVGVATFFSGFFWSNDWVIVSTIYTITVAGSSGYAPTARPWCSNDARKANRLRELPKLIAAESATMPAHEMLSVSTGINHLANDDKECAAPVELAEPLARLFL